MKRNKFPSECPSCGGELEYEGRYRRGNFRHELYRCKDCRLPVEKSIDKPIGEKYPIIKSLSIEVSEKRTIGSRIFNKESIGAFLYCTNPKCTNPGIYLEPTIQDMIEKKQRNHVIREFCSGVELTPTGRTRDHCDQYFKITIDLVFEEN